MIDDKFDSARRRIIALCVFLLCCVLILPRTLAAQTPASTAVIMVEIQCKPGTADLWREAFTKEIVPSIREAIQKGDAFTNFTYFEAPLPAQDIDFILLFEMKSFASLDARRTPPHYEALFRRLGPERAESVVKEMGNWEKTVRVSILRSYKVQ